MISVIRKVELKRMGSSIPWITDNGQPLDQHATLIWITVSRMFFNFFNMNFYYILLEISMIDKILNVFPTC